MLIFFTISVFVLFLFCFVLLLMLQKLRRDINLLYSKRALYISDEVFENAALDAEQKLKASNTF